MDGEKRKAKCQKLIREIFKRGSNRIVDKQPFRDPIALMTPKMLWNERMTESNTQIETLSCIETTKRRTHKGTHNPITGFQSSTRLT